MKWIVTIAIGMMLLSTDALVTIEGTVYCKVCHRALIRADQKSCHKLVPEFDDKMLMSMCSVLKYPVLMSCPFDGGELELVEDRHIEA
jgi:hypothetical protein